MSPSSTEPSRFALSFVVPTYNRYPALCRLLGSLRAAGAWDPPTEVIVVDDGSSDATSTLPSDGTMRVLRQPNAGPAAARNRGAKAATGTHLAFIDDDCQLAEDYLAVAQREAVERHGQVFGGPALPMDKAKPTLAGRYLRANRLLQDPIADIEGRIMCLASANLVIERELFIQLGGFWEGIRKAGGEDTHLTLRLRQRRVPSRFIHQLRVYHDVDISLGDLWRKYYRYGIGAAYAAAELNLDPQRLGLLTDDAGELLSDPLGYLDRLVGYTLYLQRRADLHETPWRYRHAVRAMAFAETLASFAGGLVGGLDARRGLEAVTHG